MPLDVDSSSIDPRVVCLVNAIYNDIESFVKAANNAVRVATLDWSELPWDQHEASSFLSQICIIMRGRKPRVPIVHINVPRAFLLLSSKAVGKYNVPPLPVCLFLEDSTWSWLGLDVPAEKSGAFRAASSDLRATVGDSSTHSEPYLQYVFDAVLEGRDYRNFRDKYGPTAWSMALEYLRRADLFRQEMTRNPSDGEVAPTGSFGPVVPLKTLHRAIAETFVSELVKAFGSSACCLPSSDRSGKRKNPKGLIRLPTGVFVDHFYRCDGLLNYPNRIPRSRPDRPAEVLTPLELQIRFREALAAHLVDVAREIETHTTGRFDIVVSCTSPTHWFVHQLADGLSDDAHHCGHFVAQSARSFKHAFEGLRINKGTKALVFTDVISTGSLVQRMTATLKAEGVIIGGLIVLLDTRTIEEREDRARDGVVFGGIDKDNRVCLCHIAVRKQPNGKARWRIDPQTLEPVEEIGRSRWIDALAGIGAVAMPGPTIARWLVRFAALRHKHYKHGSRHSEFFCDVKRLLKRPEVRSAVGARLNLYVRQNNIDLIVYPNHSNAYVMAHIFREIAGSEQGTPPLQVALCRDSRGERIRPADTVI